MSADSPNDHNGVAVALGDTVKLQGTVTAIDLLSNRFHDITIQLSYPLSSSVFSGPPVGMEGGDLNPPGARITISVPASMLTH